MKRKAAILAALALIGMLLTGCEWGVSLEDAKAQQIRAEAELEQARAEADRERAETRQYEAAQNHARTMELIPFVVLIGGGFLLAVFGGLLFWQISRERPAAGARGGQPTQAPALPTPAINVFVLTTGDGGRRADRWRQLETEAARRQELAGGNRGEVIIYDDRQRP